MPRKRGRYWDCGITLDFYSYQGMGVAFFCKFKEEGQRLPLPCPGKEVDIGIVA